MIFVSFAFLFFVHAQEVKHVNVKIGDKLVSHKAVADLKKLQEAHQAKRYKDCLTISGQVEKKLKEVQDWISYKTLICAQQHFKIDSSFYKTYSKLIEDYWKAPASLFWGNAARPFRGQLVESSLSLAEYEVANQPKIAWGNISQLLLAQSWLDGSQLAQLYKIAGDLSFSQKDFESARSYYRRSLSKVANPALVARVESLSKTLERKNQVSEVRSKRREIVYETSAEELALLAKVRKLSEQGKYVELAKSGVEFIRAYPGSRNSQDVFKLISSAYLTLAARSDAANDKLKLSLLDEMIKADGPRLYEWAKLAALREYFSDAILLAESAYKDIQHHVMSAEILLFAGVMAQNSAQLKKAEEFFSQVHLRNGDSRIASEALFRLGLVKYRLEKYEESVANFKKFLQLPHYNDFELSSLYWQWRSLQALEKFEEAKSVANELMVLYPISYYGLRARAELNGGKLKFADDNKKPKEWSFAFTPSESAAWQRFLILNEAGWVEEAARELQFLAEPEAANGKVVFAYIWSQLGDYYKASEVLYRAFSLDNTLISPATLSISFPRPFFEEIKKEANRYGFSPDLVLALMKQESSFRTEVRSLAGALGLMQIMPVTAREVASDMRIKINNLVEDMYEPEKNIRIGTQYLNRRIRAFSGHVPLALGAYNAGIGNIRNWLKSRPDLAEIQSKPSSDPAQEMWFDELPWSETSGYVKSILRNYLVYQVLDQSEINLKEPIWKIE